MRLRITVIVCAHNEERSLPACLHSILAQTRPPDELLAMGPSEGAGPRRRLGGGESR